MSVRFFLGANSGDGFYSLYDNFACAPGDRLHLIKAGPGCGKSTFMKKLASRAEDQGFTVEYILCSGDPESLDGVYIPALHLGLADATAPHILEPRLFAIDSCYVNLGQFCSSFKSEKANEYTAKYRQLYKTAYGFYRRLKLSEKFKFRSCFAKTMLFPPRNVQKAHFCVSLAKSTAHHGKGASRSVL